MPTFSIHTLGCRANQADSERLSEILLGAGFAEVPFGQPADCQIVNTCTITREADRKSGQLVRRALSLGPQVVATGCAVAARHEKLPTAALRLPPGQTGILELLGGCPSTQLVESHRHARALLRVQDGCDQFCTFCIVPYVRGRSRSVPLCELLEQAQEFERRGYREVVLTGIHLSAWGREFELDLADLVETVLAKTRTVRLRLASVEPDLFPRRLIGLMQREPRLCPHLHLVLQHASDRILQRMHRGYDLQHYQGLVEQFTGVANFCLTTDLMVGFPGETDEDFRRLLNYVEQTPFYRIHVFPYSQRPGTAAARFAEQVAPEVRNFRRDRLLRLARRKRLEFLRQRKHQLAEVLVESRDDRGWVQGTSADFLTVQFKGPPGLRGRVAQIRLTHLRGDVLRGKLEGVSA